MGVNSSSKTVKWQFCDCDLNSGPTAPQSSTLTTRLPSHPASQVQHSNKQQIYVVNLIGRFDTGSASDDVGWRDGRLRSFQRGTEHVQCHFNEWLTSVSEHEVIVGHAVADRVVSTDHVEQRREQRQRVTVLRRREVRYPLICSTVRLRCACRHTEYVTYVT